MMRTVFAIFIAVALSAGAAQAQSVTNAFDGFSGNSDEPVNIEADRLEVRDKNQSAVFTGNVVVTQGKSRLETPSLTVFYTGGAMADTAASARSIRRLEARGGVVVTSEDQRASGDRGDFDVASNIVTMNGNVVLTQGENVIRGESLHVDLNTKQSRVDPGRAGGRVQGVFAPGKGASGKN